MSSKVPIEPLASNLRRRTGEEGLGIDLIRIVPAGRIRGPTDLIEVGVAHGGVPA